MARNNYTPATALLELPLAELGLWIQANNVIVQEEMEQLEKSRNENKRR